MIKGKMFYFGIPTFVFFFCSLSPFAQPPVPTKEQIRNINFRKVRAGNDLNPSCMKVRPVTDVNKCIQPVGKLVYASVIPNGMEAYCTTLKTKESQEYCSDALAKGSDHWAQEVSKYIDKKYLDGVRAKWKSACPDVNR
ncbi:MAG TPA: hypothetical protein VJL87_03340 [Bdellovibrionota bacterium]|nr:hypothetical protein [Bdellovibrionota bacterium]